jgi:hypothetical protein
MVTRLRRNAEQMRYKEGGVGGNARSTIIEASCLVSK